MNERHAMWHRMTADAVCEQLHTDAACGLSRKAARSRFKKRGANTLFDSGRGDPYRWLLGVLRDVSLLLLLFSLILSLFFSQIALALTTLVVLGIFFIVWVRVLNHVKKSEERISRYRIPKVTVIREGKAFSILADHVVVGDLLLLREGDIVPADCRLLLANDLRVATLMPNESGKPVFVGAKKTAQAIYLYGNRTEAPYLENMLYAGSEILGGEARGIVTEIGQETYLGGLEGVSIPGELRGERKDRGERTLNALQPYFRLYGVAMLVFLLLFSAVGFFSVTEDTGFLEIFVSLCTLCAAASPLCILLYFRVFSMHGKTQAMHARPPENQAIIKSERGSEALASITDLFVIGHKASSDGILHFYRAFLPSGEAVPKEGEPMEALQPLCEALCLLHTAKQGAIAADPIAWTGEEHTVLREELITASGFDIDAMRIRLLRSYLTSSPYEKEQKIKVQTRETEFSLLFSRDIKMLDQCFLYTEGGKHFSLSPDKKEAFRQFYARMSSEGAESLLVAKQNADGVLSFLGILSAREEAQAILPSVIEELAQSGVRTTFFFSGSPEEERAYARACRIRGEAVACSREERFVEEGDLEAHRIFIGLSREAIARLLQRLCNAGRRVAVLGAEAGDRDILRLAHVVIACDPTPHREVTGENELTQLPLHNGDGCPQVIRRHADILIHRAKRLAGGASAILGALSHCRSVSIKMRCLLAFLTVSQLSRLLLTLFSLCFGIGVIGGAQMAYTGFFAESVAALWILTLPIPQNRLRKYEIFGARGIERFFFDIHTYLPICIAAFGTALLSAILLWTGVVERAELSSASFLSLLFLQLTVLYQTIRFFGIRPGVKKALFPALLICLPVLLAILLCILFSPVESVIGMGKWGIVGGALTAAMPIFYCLARFFLVFFHRTAK
ncbi:MAG: cation-transporting P-type ATPase [Clostridia bacterium]|nr:cation-transporting P-type ATPase [Clostridia bacterium]